MSPRPIFLIGMPRSGTTLVFECLAAHPDVGWLAHHANRFPTRRWLYAAVRLCDVSLAFRKSIERSDQRRPLREKLRLGPAEAYETWASLCGEKFRYDWLHGVEPTDAECTAVRALVADVLRFSGKTRFAAKLTGPPRLAYLHAIFPDAIFVHVLRDARAVVSSLLRVPFWRDTRRLREPAWRGGLTDDDLRAWEASGRAPDVLAAVQWRRVVELAREESAALGPGQYHEVRYEDFLAEPEGMLDRLVALCALRPSARPRDFLRRRFALRDMNRESASRLGAGERARVEEVAGPLLRALGYTEGASARTGASPGGPG